MPEHAADGEVREALAWRVGSHYGIHVYQGDEPVATFFRESDARRAVEAIARVEAVRGLLDAMSVEADPYSVQNSLGAGRIHRRIAEVVGWQDPFNVLDDEDDSRALSSPSSGGQGGEGM